MQSVRATLLRPFFWFKKQSKKKKIIISLVVILVLFFVIKSLTAPDKKDEYITEYPKYESITETVTETGNIVTSARVDVYSTTTGVVDQVYVANGDQVKTGDQLFSVRSTANQQEKSTASANYLAAKSALDAARATDFSLQAGMYETWDEYKNLAESGDYENDNGTPRDDKRTLPEFIISKDEWLAAEAHYKNQQQKIAQAQAQTTAMWQAYQATQDSTVYATIDGTIYNVSVYETDAVLAKGEVGAAPVLVTADLSKTRIAVELNELDISKVTVGQKAEIDVDAISDTTFTGTVQAVDAIGTDVQGVVSYNVYITLAELEGRIKPGMTATVDIVVSEKERVLTVSSSAIRPYEGKRAVQVFNPETKELEFIPVEIGLRGKDRTEIISGIDEHTEIIQALTNDQVERDGPGFFGG